MKNIAAITQDGLEGSIELIKFLKECNDDLYESIIALIGNSAIVFVTGGSITEASGNTTITDGIILKDGKLYRFTGGTVAGTPSGLNVLFESNLAPGYDPVYFDGDPIAKDIYLANTARIDPLGSTALSTIAPFENIHNTNDLLATEVSLINSELNNKVNKGIVWLNPTTTHPNIVQLEASRPKIRASINDTGLLLIEFSFASTVNLLANTTICTFNNLLPGYVWTKVVPVSCKQNGGNATLSHFQFIASGNTLIISNLTPIASPYLWVIQLITLIP